MDPFSTTGEFQLRFAGLLRAIASIAAPSASLGDSRKTELLEVVKEMRDYGMRTLQAEGAILHMMPDMTDDVLRRIGIFLAADDERSIVDSLEAILEILGRVDGRLITDQLRALLDEVGRMNRWATDPMVRHSLDVAGRIAMRFPELFSGELESCTLIGLRRIRNYTTAEGGEMDLFDKLQIRKAGARLAYRLNEHYRAREGAVPEEVNKWEGICQSESEFDDIRNQWLRTE